MCSDMTYDILHGCKNDQQGLDYQGTLDHSVTGASCWNWTSVYRWLNETDVINNNIHNAFNYCRNPTNFTLGPWCWISDPYGDYGQVIDELCALPICDMPQEHNEKYMMNPYNVVSLTNTREFAHKIIQFVFPICIILGTVSNCLSIAVFTRPALKRSTTAFLLIVLAMVDMMSLIGTLESWLRHMTDSYLAVSSDLSCKIYMYIYYVLTTFAGWVLVAVTFERVIAIRKPHSAKLICNHLRIVLANYIL